MRARIWIGEVPLDRSDAYRDLMVSRALPEYTATAGNLGAWCLRRHLEGRAEFVMLTFWESEAAIRAFSGDDISVARYYDFDPEMLVEMRPNADHFEVFRL